MRLNLFDKTQCGRSDVIFIFILMSFKPVAGIIERKPFEKIQAGSGKCQLGLRLCGELSHIHKTFEVLETEIPTVSQNRLVRVEQMCVDIANSSSISLQLPSGCDLHVKPGENYSHLKL